MPSMHHPRRRNVTTLMVGLKNGHIRKNLTQKVVNPRDIAGERTKKKKKIVFVLALFYWLKPLTDVRGEETRVRGGNP